MCKNLITRKGSQKYYFRMNVPVDLQSFIGKKVIKLSLDTADKRKAAKMVKSLTAQWKDNYKVFRAGETNTASECSNPPATREVDDDINISSVKPFPLSKVIPIYIDMKQGNWEIRSITKFSAELHEFLEISGDVPIAQIGHATIRGFRDTLLKLPSHRHKKKAYRSKTIAQLLESKIPEKDLLSDKTVDDKIKTVSGFLKWAEGEGYVDRNYALGKGIKGSKPTSAVFQPYSDSDILNIFNHRHYTEDCFSKDWQFWMPILALFTGARQSALAALLCDDLRQTPGGIWYIHISKDKTKAGKRDVPLHDFITKELNFPAFVASLKAQGHDRIFNTKFQNNNYGHEVSKWYNGSFIPKIAIEEPEEGRRKTFHSFRGTLINAAKQNGSDVAMIEETVGHSDSTGKRNKSMSTDYYSSDYYVETRYKNVIQPVHFVVEDLEHLWQSKFVGRNRKTDQL